MAGLPQSRARRYDVNWPVRVRTPTTGQWSTGTSVNLSISGVLVEVRRPWRIGELLELELEFPSPGAERQTVGAIGQVTRTDRHVSGRAAIQFDLTGTGKGLAPALDGHIRLIPPTRVVL